MFLPRASFERVNKEREENDEPLFANPRNMAAGTMRTLEPALVAKRKLGAFVYQLLDTRSGREETAEDAVADKAGGEARVEAAAGEASEHSHSRVLTMLHEWGLPVHKHWRRCESIDAVIEHCREWADKRHGLDFDTDGVVIKLDDLELREQGRQHQQVSALGVRLQVSRAAGDHESCKKIRVNIGRTGAVTPYAELEPVKLSGHDGVDGDAAQRAGDRPAATSVEGDTVLVEKAGEIIPQVVKPIVSLRPPNEEDRPKWKMPTHCREICQTELRKEEDEVVWRCPQHVVSGAPAAAASNISRAGAR